MSVAASTVSKKQRDSEKNKKILNIVNVIFDKKKMNKVTKLEAEFADGSKFYSNLYIV